jgi:hypothetical protein
MRKSRHSRNCRQDRFLKLSKASAGEQHAQSSSRFDCPFAKARRVQTAAWVDLKTSRVGKAMLARPSPGDIGQRWLEVAVGPEVT